MRAEVERIDEVYESVQDRECMIADDIARERLESLLWDVRETVEEKGSDEEFAMLQKKIGWVVMHIARFHPGLRIQVSLGKTPPEAR